MHPCTRCMQERVLCPARLHGQQQEEALLCFSGPPVNVTCNIFINSFGSVTETTMVRVLLAKGGSYFGAWQRF